MGTHKLSILRREGGVTKHSDLRPADFRFFIIYAHHVEPPLARRWSPTSILARGCGRYLVLARTGVFMSGGACAPMGALAHASGTTESLPHPSRLSTDGN